MRAAIAITIGVLTAGAPLSAGHLERIDESATVLREIHTAPDKGIPNELWSKANCIAVFPGLKKAAFVVGGEYGKGVLSCRHDGVWSAPAFIEIAKGSWGLQIGAQSIDLVLLVMNSSGMEKLLRNKVTLGAEASVAGGPVGRDARAATDAQLKAEILAYSRTQGLFAGVNITGGVINSENSDNADVYGKGVSVREIVMGGRIKPPASAKSFMNALQRG